MHILAVNQGHRHPKIIDALVEQAGRVTLTSRAFHNDQLGPWYEKICKLTNKNMALPMNTGAEAVETAVKAARRWAYEIKGVEKTRQKSSHVKVTSMDVPCLLFPYHLKQNISVVLGQCYLVLN